MNDEIDDVVRLLAQLAVADARLRAFGASGHRYRLGATIQESDLDAFEQEHGIQLPADYRMFLGMVGDGGAGPYYGLIPLASSTDHCLPAQIFPYTKAAFVLDPTALHLAPDEVETPQADQADLFDSLPGVLRLAQEGCGYYAFLVVNGPARGTVWNDWRAADYGLLPTKLTFIGWYRQWIDRSLQDLPKRRWWTKWWTG
jgi:hypothetical protein